MRDDAIGTARFDLSDFGRVQVIVYLSGDSSADTERILGALQAVNDATRDVIGWGKEDAAYKSLAEHLLDAWKGGSRGNAAPGARPAQQTRRAPAQRRSGQSSGEQREWAPGTGRYCRADGIEVAETKKEWQEYDEVDGERVPAKWTHPRSQEYDEHGGEGAFVSVYRSETFVKDAEPRQFAQSAPAGAERFAQAPPVEDELPF